MNEEISYINSSENVLKMPKSTYIQFPLQPNENLMEFYFEEELVGMITKDIELKILNYDKMNQVLKVIPEEFLKWNNFEREIRKQELKEKYPFLYKEKKE